MSFSNPMSAVCIAGQVPHSTTTSTFIELRGNMNMGGGMSFLLPSLEKFLAPGRPVLIKHIEEYKYEGNIKKDWDVFVRNQRFVLHHLKMLEIEKQQLSEYPSSEFIVYYVPCLDEIQRILSKSDIYLNLYLWTPMQMVNLINHLRALGILRATKHVLLEDLICSRSKNIYLL